jgi:hypothetical protein
LGLRRIELEHKEREKEKERKRKRERERERGVLVNPRPPKNLHVTSQC